MNMTNLFMRIVILLALLGAMAAVSYIDADFYKIVMMGIGGWQLGGWVSEWARKHWPT